MTVAEGSGIDRAAAAELIRGIKAAQSVGFTLVGLGPIVSAHVAGSLDDDSQRELLAAKLNQIEDRRRQLAEMSQFLRSKLDDLNAPHSMSAITRCREVRCQPTPG